MLRPTESSFTYTSRWKCTIPISPYRVVSTPIQKNSILQIDCKQHAHSAPNIRSKKAISHLEAVLSPDRPRCPCFRLEPLPRTSSIPLPWILPLLLLPLAPLFLFFLSSFRLLPLLPLLPYSSLHLTIADAQL